MVGCLWEDDDDPLLISVCWTIVTERNHFLCVVNGLFTFCQLCWWLWRLLTDFVWIACCVFSLSSCFKYLAYLICIDVISSLWKKSNFPRSRLLFENHSLHVLNSRNNCGKEWEPGVEMMWCWVCSTFVSISQTSRVQCAMGQVKEGGVPVVFMVSSW